MDTAYQLLTDPDERFRAVALDMFARHDSDAAIDVLIRAFLDENEEIRQRAVALLGSRHVALNLPTLAEAQPLPEVPAEMPAFGYQVKFLDAAKRVLAELADEELIRTVIDTACILPGLQRLLILAAVDILGIDWCRRVYVDLQEAQASAFPSQVTVATTYECNLKCPYCCAAGYGEKINTRLRPADFEKIIIWAQKNAIRRFSFTGGEPTLHPDFSRFVRQLTSVGNEYYFATNGLFSEQVRDTLIAVPPLNIVFHVNDGTFYSAAQRRQMESNLGQLRENGVCVYLRFNLYEVDQDWTFPLWLCDRYNVSHVNFAVVFPSESSDHCAVEAHQLSDHAAAVVGFVRTCEERGIRTRLSKPLPLCIFSDDEQWYLLSRECLSCICDIHHNHFANNVVVGPDQSVLPCIALSLRGPELTSFDSLKAVGESFRTKLRECQAKPLFPKCMDCEFYHTQQCQGGCLAYKLYSAEPREELPSL